ncbi:MAG: gamma-glutamyl-gamma-aminobutyrate hydrolase family protein [bacterium]|nr:gamma-glutamyl-gamma-aminobutyrate hydrolase family protein [bacterium]
MIKVGVTPCMMHEDDSRTSFAPKKLNYLVQDMARYIQRDGVMPILIPSLPPKELRDFVAHMDGIVLQGGDDIAPETFGEKPIGKWRGDSLRDEIELDIIKYAIEFDLPVFGICRGFQLMNVFFGGTLYQDIPTQFETLTLHKGTNYDQNIHTIDIVESSYLFDINNEKTQGTVNSIHHQGVKAIGKSLNVIATDSQDDLAEAFYSEEYEVGKVMGVQWHPEFNWNHAEQLVSAEKLYDQFLKFASNNKS